MSSRSTTGTVHAGRPVSMIDTFARWEAPVLGDDDPLRGIESGEPLDLAALRADDDFIEHFACGRVPLAGTNDPVDDELAAMFSAWVHEVRPETAAAATEA